MCRMDISSVSSSKKAKMLRKDVKSEKKHQCVLLAGNKSEVAYDDIETQRLCVENS